jgi:hypothetical protein
MSMPFETNWKTHIDPDFDSAIRTFLFYIHGILKDTDSGYFAVKDEVLQTILKNQGWQDFYKGNEWIMLVQEITEMKDDALFGVSLNQNSKEGQKPNPDESSRLL